MKVIYFIQVGDGKIKVGTTWNAKKYLNKLQKNNPEQLKLLGVMPYRNEINVPYGWHEPTKEILDIIRDNSINEPCDSDSLIEGETYLSIEEASALLGVTQQTLRNWESKKKIFPKRTTSGHRRYTKEQIDKLKIEQIKDDSILLPDITIEKLKMFFNSLLSPFNDNDEVTFVINKDHLNEKVSFSINSSDYFTSSTKTFNMDDRAYIMKDPSNEDITLLLKKIKINSKIIGNVNFHHIDKIMKMGLIVHSQDKWKLTEAGENYLMENI